MYGFYDKSTDKELSLSRSILWEAIQKQSVYNSCVSERFAVQAVVLLS